MIPNYKRPTFKEYLLEALDRPLEDQDLDMIEYCEQLEKEKAELERMLRHRIKYSQELEEDLFEGCSNYVVPKSVIREKIEELEANKNMNIMARSSQTDILKELLGEEK